MTAHRMLKKSLTAMTHRDSIYRLQKLIGFDDAYVGRKRSDKRGHGVREKPVLIAVEHFTKNAGLVAMQAVETVTQKAVRNFFMFHLKLDRMFAQMLFLR